MQPYAAFFRGINVGGKHIVKMEELKQFFTRLGFRDVKTYIQSGNVVFSADRPESELVSLITQAFEAQFGFQSAVMIRAADEIAAMLHAQPFDAAMVARAMEEAPDVEHLYVFLSDDAPDRQMIETLCAGYEGPDRLHIDGREIHLFCSQSIRDSKLVAHLGKLPHPLTARNLKTIAKIDALMREANP